VRNKIDDLVAQLGQIIVGKEQQLRLAVACVLARGHLLIEDVPGVGKTTLSQAIAFSLGLGFRRIQFTSDLLPADILGNSIFDRETNRFVFHRGPIFSNLILIDEVNRATPKTQSALLEAMEENQVSLDGVTHPLPKPFFVIATQNPTSQVGTFPLPESQLDRFMMRIHLGFPDREREREMLLGGDRRALTKLLTPVFPIETLIELQTAAAEVHVAPALLDYLLNIFQATRERHRTGLSPRAGLAMLGAAKAWAFSQGHDMVLPEDVQAIALSVMAHRLGDDSGVVGEQGQSLAREILETVPVD
jgi:MoxR-like ATPase